MRLLLLAFWCLRRVGIARPGALSLPPSYHLPVIEARDELKKMLAKDDQILNQETLLDGEMNLRFLYFERPDAMLMEIESAAEDLPERYPQPDIAAMRKRLGL